MNDMFEGEFVYQCSKADAEFIITDEPYHTVALQAMDQLPLIKVNI